MKKWQTRAASCQGKQKHDRATASYIARKGKRKGLQLVIYDCPFCGHWHVGSRGRVN